MHPLVVGSVPREQMIDGAAETGDAMLAGTQNLSIQDVDAAYNAPDGEVAAVNVRGAVVGTPTDPPPLPQPAPDRPAVFQRAYTLMRDWGGPYPTGPQLLGQHGEIATGAGMPPGIQKPQVPSHGNTWRLQPQPWDSPLWVAQYGQDEAHAP